MLVDGACSIYDARPRTCRSYDCRVVTVTGVDPDDQPDIADATRRWRFVDHEDHKDHEDGRTLDRIRATVDLCVARPLDPLDPLDPAALSVR